MTASAMNAQLLPTPSPSTPESPIAQTHSNDDECDQKPLPLTSAYINGEDSIDLTLTSSIYAHRRRKSIPIKSSDRTTLASPTLYKGDEEDHLPIQYCIKLEYYKEFSHNPRQYFTKLLLSQQQQEQPASSKHRVTQGNQTREPPVVSTIPSTHGNSNPSSSCSNAAIALPTSSKLFTTITTDQLPDELKHLKVASIDVTQWKDTFNAPKIEWRKGVTGCVLLIVSDNSSSSNEPQVCRWRYPQIWMGTPYSRRKSYRRVQP